MAIGDITSPVISANGKQVTISIEGMDGTLITQIESNKTCTLNCTSEGYSASTLGTVSRSMLCSFVSASGASPASIILAPIEPIYNDDVSVTFDADVAAFDDGSNTSTVTSGVSATGTVTLDYPLINTRIAGVLDSSNNIKVKYSDIDGTVTAEAVALGAFANGQPASAVKFELNDGTTTLTQTVLFMSRSKYNPTRFYAACVAAGLVASDPYTTNSGGSGVYAASFDTTLLVDGAATLTITAYPVVGDAASVRIDSWALYINNSASLTVSNRWFDSRASVPHSGVTGTFSVNEKITGGTSGAIMRFKYESSGVIYFSAMDNTNLVSGEVLTGEISAATATTSSTATYNGVSTAAATLNDPRRILILPAGTIDTKYNIYLKGDTSYITHYGLGRSSTGATVSAWMTITPSAGITKADIMILGGEGKAFSDSRDKRVHFKDVLIYSAFRGDNTRDTALWLEDCEYTSFNGRDGASNTWGFAEWNDSGGGGAFFTKFYSHFHDYIGIDQAEFARDLHILQVNEDAVRECSLGMEIFAEDNDSPDALSHEDGLQFQDSVDSNRIYYNMAMVDIISEQLFLSDDVVGTSICNFLAMASVANTAAFSQYGNSSQIHVVNNLFMAHWTFVNAQLEHRDFAGSVDQNTFLRFSVVAEFNGRTLTYASLHNHLTNSSDSEINTTIDTDGNPWTSGVSALTNDNASTRDYTPGSATIKNRIPAGERYIPFDLFSTDVLNDGTGAIGALQIIATSISKSFTSKLTKNITSNLIGRLIQ